MFLRDGNSNFVKWLRDANFVIRLTSGGYIWEVERPEFVSLRSWKHAYLFFFHDKIRSFKRKLQLWKQTIETENFDCLETVATFLNNNERAVPGGICTEIVEHLYALDSNLEIYFEDSMQKCASRIWVATSFQPQPSQLTRVSTQANEQLIDLYQKIQRRRKTFRDSI